MTRDGEGEVRRPACGCPEPHPRCRIVLTGGPGAGKTAILELARRSFCAHVRVLPEAAGIVFGGGFPRSDEPGARRAAQRAIYGVQRELEAAADATGAAVVLCDRGTIDSAAYWPGPDDFWEAVGASVEAELARYDAVVHLRTPRSDAGYDHRNPLRTESAAEAGAIDARILAAWAGHRRRVIVEPAPDFLVKATAALAAIRAALPACCAGYVAPAPGAQG